MVYRAMRFFDVKKTNMDSFLFVKPGRGRFSALRRFFLIDRRGVGRNRKDKWVSIFFPRIASKTYTPNIYARNMMNLHESVKISAIVRNRLNTWARTVSVYGDKALRTMGKHSNRSERLLG